MFCNVIDSVFPIIELNRIFLFNNHVLLFSSGGLLLGILLVFRRFVAFFLLCLFVHFLFSFFLNFVFLLLAFSSDYTSFLFFTVFIGVSCDVWNQAGVNHLLSAQLRHLLLFELCPRKPHTFVLKIFFLVDFLLLKSLSSGLILI